MGLKKDNKVQCLAEDNEKILDLDNIKYILSEYEEYQVLSNLIKKLADGREIKRILINGDDPILLYPQLLMIFPNAQFFITNKSRDILNSFIENYNQQKMYFVYTLDVLKGVSLHDFIYNNSKFDLIIINKIYSKVKKKKRYFSLKFLYKYYLRRYGILCLINYIRKSKLDKFQKLKPINPVLEKNIPVKNEKYLVQFILYTKKN